MSKMTGKVVWIVGASSGIGRALAHELSKRGAKLIVSARSKDKLKSLVKELEGEALAAPCDVVDIKSLEKAMKAGREAFATIDSVVHLAAIYDPMALRALDIEKTHAITNVNLNGVFNLLHVILPYYRKRHKGQIALCGSVAGYCGLPQGQPYSATKAAVMNIAQSLKSEEEKLNIKLISPGFVDTDLTAKNDFEMPMIISVEKAAKALANGLESSGFEIRFPFIFTSIMKLLAGLPYRLYFFLTQKLER
ncbi:MAG: short-chain dehydrogenase [Micavibrio sp.]|nr:short-chain dehydrogenase [Micavibrio sp.]|tara:strand:- start:18641 stop:19390 length:750 start_codon:yes stop_codon:yes gene_type:complete